MRNTDYSGSAARFVPGGAVVRQDQPSPTPVNNWTAASSPLTTDDASKGYLEGSHWYNKSTGKVYICVAATIGGAKWVLLN